MYQTFFDLAKREIEGKDFRIVVLKRDSPVTIIAPHGGRIEPGTAELAWALAGQDFSFYAFEGIKKKKNFEMLHITSNQFDEPGCVRLVARSQTVITVHGCKELELFVRVGGRDEKLKNLITEALRGSRVRVEAGLPGQSGAHGNNICNRGLSGKGIQLEITSGLRRVMFGLSGRSTGEGKLLLDNMVKAVRGVILNREA